MKFRQEVYRYAPPQFIHWAKCAVDPVYRGKSTELARIRAVPRFHDFRTSITGHPITFVDSASFLWMYDEIFEQQIYKFLAKSRSPYIIDGGSNIGLSVIYFKQLYPNSKILAFEADERIFEVLKSNIESHRYDDVELHCKAIWSSETALSFMSEGADGGRLSQGNDPKGKLTQTVRLRTYLDRPIDFLKLDIEGAETEVLEDCADLLGNIDNLFVEYHSFVDAPQTLHRIATILANSGFRVHIHPPITSPQPFVQREINAGMDMQLNVFAFRV